MYFHAWPERIDTHAVDINCLGKRLPSGTSSSRTPSSSSRASAAVDTPSAAETIIQFCASESITVGLVPVPADIAGGARREHPAIALWRGGPARRIVETCCHERARHSPTMPYTTASKWDWRPCRNAAGPDNLTLRVAMFAA